MTMIDIPAKDESGTFKAYVSRPNGDGPHPCLVVLQEIFGINQVMRDICDEMAEQGYIAICPDLFWRIEPGIELTDKTEEEWEKAFELFKAFDAGKGMEDIQSTLNQARKLDGTNGKAGTIGFCLGGKLAYLSATRTDTNCSVGYYGVDLGSHLDEAKNISNPLLLHIAGQDQFTPEEEKNTVMEGLKPYDLVYQYEYPEQDHAFARPGGEHYDAQAAKKANDRTAKFLETYLK
mgnify:CR=1 FL=1